MNEFNNKYTGKFRKCIKHHSKILDMDDIVEYVDTMFFNGVKAIRFYNHNKDTEISFGESRVDIFIESVHNRRKRIINEI